MTVRDEDDYELDELDMAVCNNETMDELFESAAAPLNTIVDMNNTLNHALSGVRHVVGLLTEAMTSKYTIGKDTDTIVLELTKDGKAKIPAADIRALLANKEIEAADEALAEAIDKLHGALQQADASSVKLTVEPSGLVSCEGETVKAQVEAVNAKMESLRGKISGYTVSAVSSRGSSSCCCCCCIVLGASPGMQPCPPPPT